MFRGEKSGSVSSTKKTWGSTGTIQILGRKKTEKKRRMVGPAQPGCGEKTLTCKTRKMIPLIVNVLPGSLLSITEITEYKYFSPLRPSRELKDEDE